jgi:hypothetical protein
MLRLFDDSLLPSVKEHLDQSEEGDWFTTVPVMVVLGSDY